MFLVFLADFLFAKGELIIGKVLVMRVLIMWTQ